MSTVSHESLPLAPGGLAWLRVPEMWASLAIVTIWLAVLFDAIFGPDIHTQEGVAGVGTSTTVPSAVAVALFAALATWPIARHGFRHDRAGS